MRRTLALLIVVIGIAMASAAAAEPRDSVDRGDRLDTNALRDDVSTNRLKAPSHPLDIVPQGQAVTTSKGTRSKKSSASGGGSR
jgi:hypothetical protein